MGDLSDSSSRSEFNHGNTSDEWDRECEYDIQTTDDFMGVTPPRQIRREKRREKTPKKNNSVEGYDGSSEKQTMERKRQLNDNRTANDQERTAQRKEKFSSLYPGGETFGVNDPYFYEIRVPNRPPVFRIEIPNTLKSINLKQPPDGTYVEHEGSNKYEPRKPIRKFNSSIPTSRLQFHKTFSLFVKLGGRSKPPETRASSYNESNSKSAWKADYIEVLWLELKAWHRGREIQEEDNYLEHARREVENVMDEVINFDFQEAIAEIEATSAGTFINPSQMNHDEHHSATGTSDKRLKVNSDNLHKSSNNIDVNSKDIVKSDHSLFSDEIVRSSNNPLRVLNSNDNLQDNFPLSSSDSTALSEGLDRTHQQLAMRAIISLISKVDFAESLYPTTRALAAQHDKYTNETFVRNMETLTLWLNTSKDLYHRMQLCARFLQIDADDGQMWQDWIDHGLGLRCIKTKQVYTKRRDSLETSTHTEGNMDDIDGVGQYGHQQRILISGLKPTSTSRYRKFVERFICQMGLAKLTDRLKKLLHVSLWRARQTLEVTASAKKDMEKYHNFEKVKKLLLFLEQMANEKIRGSLFSSMQEYLLNSDDFRYQKEVDRGVWSAGFKEMSLPSFLELYLFLVKVPFDLVLECIRYRLEHQPKGDPSNLSIRQLLQECKEVIYIGILAKYYFQDMSLSVLTADDSGRIDWIDTAISEFENEMQKMLNLYFEYIQSLFQMLQRLPQASQRLKNVIEEEWEFAKVMCPHIKGGESQAGYQFCVLASGLLESCRHFLESSLDERASSLNFDPETEDNPRHKVLEACRNFKQIFNETKQRVAKAIGFAKMLQKDLGIAAEFSVKVPVSDMLRGLEENKFVKVDCLSSASFDIYAPEIVSKDKSHIVQLLTVTCGFEDPAKADPTPSDGYILLLNRALEDSGRTDLQKWTGEVIEVSPTIEITITLAKIEVGQLLLVSYNAFKTAESRKLLCRTLGSNIEIINEQTSSHEIIAEAMVDLKEKSLELSKVIADSVARVASFFDAETSYEMEEQERALIRANHVEAMLVSFTLGFEYFKEITHLITGKRRAELGPKLHEFARMWMRFVTTKVERGRGRQPRWASHGLGFLLLACEPKHLTYLEEDEFKKLKKEMYDCVHHIVGKADQGSRSSSPLPIHRGRSYPPSTTKAQSGRPDRPVSEGERRFPGSENSTPQSASVFSPFDTSADNSDSEGNSSLHLPSSHRGSRDTSPACLLQFHDVYQNEGPQLAPIARIRQAVSLLEEGRNEQLAENRIIGQPTDKASPVASDLVQFNARRVNFKWQLGRVVGEGQFGKVFTCINLDTGDIMAMKQVRFNRNDYSATQEIADEIKNIEGLNHHSLVKYYGVELHRDEMLIFMEYCADGTIAEVAKLGLPEQMIRVYTYQINDAIHFLHMNGIIHRDIKGTNIFLATNEIIKLGDFGSAVKLKNPLHTMKGEVARTRGVTAAYMAPEVITHDKWKGYGRSADIWSLGCVVIEMVTGKIPWSETDNMFSIMYRVGKGESPPAPESFSDEGKDFISKCFIRDPRKRWTAEQLEDHPFVKVGVVAMQHYFQLDPEKR